MSWWQVWQTLVSAYCVGGEPGSALDDCGAEDCGEVACAAAEAAPAKQHAAKRRSLQKAPFVRNLIPTPIGMTNDRGSSDYDVTQIDEQTKSGALRKFTEGLSRRLANG